MYSFQYLKNPLPKAEINENLASKTPFVFKLVKTCVMMNKRAKGIFGGYFLEMLAKKGKPGFIVQ